MDMRCRLLMVTIIGNLDLALAEPLMIANRTRP